MAKVTFQKLKQNWPRETNLSLIQLFKNVNMQNVNESSEALGNRSDFGTWHDNS